MSTETPFSNESRLIKFILLIIVSFISTICSSYILYNVVKYRLIRRRFHNHTLIIHVILVVLYTLFNIPTTISFYGRGTSLVATKTYCIVWEIGDYLFSALIIWCKAILTIERYVLVFHPQYLRSDRQKFFFHSIPLLIISIYIISFYIFINIFCPWEIKPNFQKYLCGSQCLDYSHGLSTFNWGFNILFPVFVVIFGSMILLLRVIWKRREMQRNLRNWSKNWKMIVQLMGLALIYTIIWIPLSIISVRSMSKHVDGSVETIDDHFYYLTYHCELLVPIMALLFWPELMQKLRGRVGQNSVASITMPLQSTN